MPEPDVQGFQGSLFNAGPFTRPRDEPQAPGWGVPHGRPQYPGQGPGPQPQAHQAPLTAAPPGYQAHPEAHGPSFATSGIGKYFNRANRNVNGSQFNGPAIRGAVGKLLDAHADAQYFSHQGMGAALRYTLQLPQVPSHRADDINARRNRAMSGGTTGINPGNMEAEVESGQHFGGETPLSFDERHGQNPDLSW